MKDFILNAIDKHNAAVKSLDLLGDVKVPASKLLSLMEISVANSRAGWALVDLAFEYGLRGITIDAQTGIISVPDSLRG